MRPTHVLALVALVLSASSAATQSPAAAPASPAADRAGSANPPQKFDWHRRTPIAATTAWGQAVDVASTDSILSWTTMPEYTTALVNHLPDHPTVVSPTKHFGYPIGRPGVLHRTDQIYSYFNALSNSSPRVNFQLLGETEEKNNLALVQIGSEANLARLEEVKRGLNALADPRRTDREAATRIIRDLPMVYTFYAGLHSTETGPPEMVMEMAYRLAVSDDPLIRTIRDSVIVFIIPVAEPDGRNRTVEWHRRHNANTMREQDRVPGPPYWGSYIFHDNNRDGLQLSARLTQISGALFEEWKYPAGHDLHESVPYLYTSTGTGPYNTQLDPIAVSEWQWMANWEVTDLTARGLPGVWTHGFYDGWYPGYLLWVTNTRNAIGRFYETFGNSVPNTIRRDLGRTATEVHWYRPNPPRSSTIWSMRNNTNYMQSGALSVLSLAAQNRTRMLDQYWTKANNAITRGRTQAPYAWVVPADQPRRGDVSYMLSLIGRQGIEVHQADAAATFGDVRVARGDYVIRMDQPYRNFVQTLMEVQRFPDNAPRPYDDVAWTYPLMFNVSASAVADSAVLRMTMRRVEGTVQIAGTVTSARGAGWWAVVPEASARSIAARWALREVPVWAAQDSMRVGSRTLPAGTWLMDASHADASVMNRLAREHGLNVIAVTAAAVQGVQRHEMDLPRVALLHSWRNTQDEGWARFTLEQSGVPYTYIGEDKLKGIRLRDLFDVVLFPSQGANATGRVIFAGVDTRHSPLAYTRTAEFPTHGYPDSTSDMTGGMGYEGLAALRDFVHEGGTLITLGSATSLPAEFGIVRDVSTAPARTLFVPGSIVKGRTAQRRHPITYGFGETMPLYHRFGPYLNVPARLNGNVMVRYAPADSLFMSGLVQNPGELGGQPAIVSVPVGKGHVVLFGFNALHRYQSHGNFAFVWNAIMNWNDLGVGIPAVAPETVTDAQ